MKTLPFLSFRADDFPLYHDISLGYMIAIRGRIVYRLIVRK